MIHAQLHVGRIQDVSSDPDKNYRVRLSVFGVHDVGLQPLPNDQLPLATCLSHTEGLQGVGTTPHYLPGSTVFCMPLDEQKQQWIVLGSTGASGKYTQAPSVTEQDGSYDVDYKDWPVWTSPTNKNPGAIIGGRALVASTLQANSLASIANTSP